MSDLNAMKIRVQATSFRRRSCLGFFPAFEVALEHAASQRA
jgi:hypothetical protein